MLNIYKPLKIYFGNKHYSKKSYSKTSD